MRKCSLAASSADLEVRGSSARRTRRVKEKKGKSISAMR